MNSSCVSTPKSCFCSHRQMPYLACLLLLGLVMSGRSFVGLLHAEEPFADRTAELGLQLSNGAACWADVNGDGWSDLCAGGVVWKNLEGERFEKFAEGVGEVVAADFDNDGDVDLFSWSSMRILRNENGERFEAIEMPELPACVSRGACWGDFNGDRFVDLYVGGYEDWDNGITYPDLILMNDSGKSFRLAWSEVRYRARGVTACDFDRDGDLDVYVSNYRLQPNVLWINNGKGEMADETEKHNALGTSPGFAGGHSIGSAWGDFDNDGRIDLFVGNFAHVDGRGDQPKSRFLRNIVNDDKTVFDDRGPSGVHYQESYASPSAGDYDNDGDLDLFFTTVYEVASFGRPNNPVLFRNDGDFQFADVTTDSGIGSQGPTYQAAWGDFDRDGDLDLISNGKLFVNQKNGGHWLLIHLEGDGQHVNQSAIGAQVRIEIGDVIHTRQVESGTGEGNQNDLLLHVGLGEHAEPVTIEVFWPNGETQAVPNVDVDQVVTLRYEGS